MSYPYPTKRLLIGKETTWGTGVTPDKDVGIIISDISDNLLRNVSESMGAGSIQAQAVTGGIEEGGLSFSGDYQHARLLEMIIGDVVHVETTGDWTHTFTVSNTPASFTAESSQSLTSDSGLEHTGVLIESADFSIALNENLQLAISAKGKIPTEVTTATAAVGLLIPTEIPNFSLDSASAN